MISFNKYEIISSVSESKLSSELNGNERYLDDGGGGGFPLVLKRLFQSATAPSTFPFEFSGI